MSFLELSNLLLWLVVIIQTAVIITLAKMLAQFLNRFRVTKKGVESAQLFVGEKAPLFRERDQHGDMVVLANSQGKRTLLLFVKESCGVCERTLAQLPGLLEQHDIRVIAIAKTSMDEFGKEIPVGVHFVQSVNLGQNYHVEKVPFMVLVDATGTILETEEITDFRQVERALEVPWKQVS